MIVPPLVSYGFSHPYVYMSLKYDYSIERLQGRANKSQVY